MNDYKELIDALLSMLVIDCEEIQNTAYEAAGAIEQLVKERDAAMSDIPATCGYCAHEDDEEWCERGCRWEWRGVQEDNDEID